VEIDVNEFHQTSKDILAPVYPVIAEMILKETGIRRGVCIDIGAGPGNLGLALAEQAPDLKVILFDLLEEMLEKAKENCAVRNLEQRIRLCRGNVEELPFEDDSADLIVSRGSVFFWEDQLRAINEIYRVLKPGGCAFIGGGFGNEALLAQIIPKMIEKNPDWDRDRKKRVGEEGYLHFTKMMKETKVPRYEINRKQAGLWIIFRK